MALTIRPVLPGEHDAVADLTASVYLTEGYGSEEYEPALRDVAGRVAAAQVLVAVDGDGLVGAVCVATRGGEWAEQATAGQAVMRMLVVDSSMRGGGVGEALVRACIDRARADGCTLLRLSTQPSMTSAHRLYERLGFVRTPASDWSPVPGVCLLGYVLPLEV